MMTGLVTSMNIMDGIPLMSDINCRFCSKNKTKLICLISWNNCEV